MLVFVLVVFGSGIVVGLLLCLCCVVGVVCWCGVGLGGLGGLCWRLWWGSVLRWFGCLVGWFVLPLLFFRGGLCWGCGVVVFFWGFVWWVGVWCWFCCGLFFLWWCFVCCGVFLCLGVVGGVWFVFCFCGWLFVGLWLGCGCCVGCCLCCWGWLSLGWCGGGVVLGVGLVWVVVFFLFGFLLRSAALIIGLWCVAWGFSPGLSCRSWRAGWFDWS
ncbi:hypothetical protein RA276_27525 [Pseudomonas syringae pv. tagetis]|uniref:hypothetical protein n=1 Tax=Pseudomonas syringae group genomosp. 7 TaxID=251699 RepID=UPI0037703F4B